LAVQRGLEEAIAICCDHIQALDSEYLHINDAFMRVAAEDIASPINVPNFDRSSIDGYAISEPSGHGKHQKNAGQGSRCGAW
jgi:molybdopterin molybdotransferase